MTTLDDTIRDAETRDALGLPDPNKGAKIASAIILAVIVAVFVAAFAYVDRSDGPAPRMTDGTCQTS